MVGDRRLVIAERLSQQKLIFNVAVKLVIKGEVNEGAIKSALDRISVTQPIFNGVWSIDSYWQSSEKAQHLHFEVENFSSDIDPILAVDGLVETQVHKPFQLATGPLARYTLIKLCSKKYMLVAIFHRSIMDDRSISVFVNQIMLIINNGDSLLVELSEVSDVSNSTISRDWWKQQFTAKPPQIKIFHDQITRDKVSICDANVSQKLSMDLVGGLRLLATNNELSAGGIFLIAWAEIVRVYSENKGMVIGISCPQNASNANAIDNRETRLPYLYKPDRSLSIVSAVSEYDRWLTKAKEHQLPVDIIIDVLQVNRDLDQPPITGVLFAENLNINTGLEKGDVEVEFIGKALSTYDFEMKLVVQDYGSNINIGIDFDPNLYLKSTVEHLTSRFEYLLKQIVLKPSKTLLELELLSESESCRIIDKFNRTDIKRSYPELLHVLFECQVDLDGNKTALRHLNTATSFKELERSANRIAWLLVHLDVEPGSIIAFAFEREPMLIAAMLGILKSGSAFVSIDATHPIKRIEHILEDSNAKYVLCDSSTAELIPSASVQLIRIDSEKISLSSFSTDRPNVEIDPGLPASIIYTSGSTGVPKGVLGTHQGLANVSCWVFDQFKPSPNEVNCIKTTPGFVDFIWEVCGALGAGVVSVIVPKDASIDPEKLIDILSKEKVTRITLVPSLLRAILDTGQDLAKVIPDLLLWLPSGEALPGDLCIRLMQAMPACRIVNTYGCSEASAISTYYEVRSEEVPVWIPIGKPIDNSQVYVLDENQQPVPEGVPGELWIGGEGLANGYHNDPEFSAERFCKISPLNRKARTLYRSGDRVRLLCSGVLEYLGRFDKQVQIRGFRVDLAEVEAVLRAHPKVTDAAVITKKLGGDDNALVAYVVLVSDDDSSVVTELRTWCADHVPGHMLPRSFIALDNLPLNTSGKLDTSKLSSIEDSSVHDSTLDDESLQRTVEIFRDVLGILSIGPDDNFFDLGGHSLLATNLAKEIQDVFNTEIKIAAIYESPTPRELSGQIRSEAGSSALVRLNKPNAIASGIPIYCIFGLFLYRDLAERLSVNHPVYGGYVDYELEIFRSINENDLKVQIPSIEELAQHYVELILKANGDMPCCIAGASFGGVVAIEIARRLRDMGINIPLVIMFDTPFTISRFHSIGEFIRDLAATILLRGGLIGRSMRSKFSGKIQSTSFERGELRQLVFEHAMRRFVPLPYDGDIVLYLAKNDIDFNTTGLRAEQEWSRICNGGFSSVHLSGKHIDILMEPNVDSLVVNLQARLSGLQSSDQS